jgi:tetratricopeptide (TPR) repeat protein
MALAAEPADSHTWNCKAAALGMWGRQLAESGGPESARTLFEQAADCLDHAIAQSPEHGGAWYNRGLLLSELGRFDEALRCLARAEILRVAGAREAKERVRIRREEESCPSHRSAADWAAEAALLARRGKHSAAEALAAHALQADARNGEAWFVRGGVLATQGRYYEALECFQHASRNGCSLADQAAARCTSFASAR